MYKSLCTLLAAATISYSTPVWGDTPKLSCEEQVEGAVQIENTDYCADRFGAIYDAAGDKLQNPKILLRIQRSGEYKEAKEGANALYLQTEAVRQRETASVLEEQVKKEQVRKKEEAPFSYLQSNTQPAAASESSNDSLPPYLQPGYQEPSSLPASSSSPSWQSSAAEQSANDKKSNILVGTLLGLGGMTVMTLGFSKMFFNGPCVEDRPYECEKPDNSLPYALMITGLVSLGVSIYFFAK